MLVKFNSLTLKNFKSHQDLTVNFGERTVITGDNAKGKSSIPEAITWPLYGTNTLGSKMDPKPITYEADETKVSLLLEVDGKDLLLGRVLRNGKVQYIINDVPSKAAEFNAIVEQLFDKDLFMSLFNPNYFFTLHWERQRSMLMQYVSAPARKDVLKQLPEAQSKNLESLLKKHSLDDLEKIHRVNKTEKDKKYIAAGSRTKTLKEQFELMAPTAPLESLKAEHAQLVKQRNEIEKVTDAAGDNNGRINVLQNRIQFLMDEQASMKQEWPKLKGETINDTCPTCKQSLQEESINAVREDKENRIEKFKLIFDKVVSDRKELQSELSSLEYIDVSERIEKVRKLQEQINPIEREIQAYKQLEAMQVQVQQAEKDEKEILKSLNDSIFILDSIKEYRAKEAEVQAEKVQSLFGNLSVKLFETLKNGEIKPTFEVMMDGKEYRKLSLSESIKAGLELRDVLSDQSEIIAPCFVDNAESITRFKEPNGQLIILRVVAGQDLQVEAVDHQ